MCASSSTNTTWGLRARIASRSISSNSVPLYSIFLRGTVSSWEAEFRDSFAAVGFDKADDNILAAAVAADRFAQHAIGLADARRVAQEQLEHSFVFSGRSGYCQPLFGCFGQGYPLTTREGARIEYHPCASRYQTAFCNFAAALGIVALIAFFYRKVLPVNATTVALTFLLAILVVSTLWGMAVSVPMSVVAMLAFNYFFLPPDGHVYRCRSAELGGAGGISGGCGHRQAIWPHARASRRRKPRARQREIEKLYAFSRDLLESGNVMELLNRIPAQIVNTFEVGAAALFLADKQKVYRSGPVVPHSIPSAEIGDGARGAGDRCTEQRVLYSGAAGRACRWAAWEFPGRRFRGKHWKRSRRWSLLRWSTHERSSNLGQTEAARQSEQLRTALLDAVTHALRTPLTSIKASVTNLLSNREPAGGQKTRATDDHQRGKRPAEPAGRRSGRNGATGRGRSGAEGGAASGEEVIQAALEYCKGALGNRNGKMNIAEGLPPVRVDVARAREVLVHLIENANQYSQPDQPITITAEPSGDA